MDTAEAQSARQAVPPPPLPVAGKIPSPPQPKTRTSATPGFADAAGFLNVAKSLPWKLRPESWWNTFSVLAGAGGGFLWFVYSSIRGLPKPGALYSSLGGSWIDFLPAVALLIFAWIKRYSLLARVFRFQEKFQRRSAGGKLGMSAILLGAAFLLTQLTRRMGVIGRGEGLDLITPILMTLLPMGLVLFRKETDRILAPIQPIRRKLGPVVAMGMSVTAPFATAHLLYHVLDLRMYPLMHVNLPIGLLVSYALARNPASNDGSSASSGGRFRAGASTWALMLLHAAIFLAIAAPAIADDFLRDPFNLNDGLRTDAVAPWLAGLPTAIVSVLVNGVEVTRVVIQGPKSTDDDTSPATANFQVVVRTVDQSGATSTTLAPGGLIRILAHCEKIGGGLFPAGDPTIRFALDAGGTHVALQDAGTDGGDRCAVVSFLDPLPSEAMPATATAVVSAGNGLISVPVTLTLNAGYVFIVKTSSEP